MVIRPQANTVLDEPARFDVDRVAPKFGGGIIPPTHKLDVFLFVDEEDVCLSFVAHDLSAVFLRA